MKKNHYRPIGASISSVPPDFLKESADERPSE